jgi:hypothetical protein
MQGLYRIRIFVFLLAGLFFFAAGGCRNTEETPGPEYVIKAGSNSISPEEFAEKLDVKLAAYPYDFKKNPVEYNQLVFDLVSILSEESVLLAAAGDAGIQVTDLKLSESVAFYREDYPEDSFDQMLLENAISYLYWENTLKNNLIIDKFIQQELKDKIEISSEDVVSFYNRHLGQEIFTDENKLVSHLRMEKSQESYYEWIMILKKRYPVDINKNALSLFLIDMENNKGHVND